MSDFGNWEKQFDKQISTVLKINTKIQVEAGKEMLHIIEKRTPVGNPSLWSWPAPKGYQPGTLKASWAIDFDSYTGGNVQMIISNGQPYAERVEFGWSTQAPQGMMRITAMEWSSIIDKVAKNHKI